MSILEKISASVGKQIADNTQADSNQRAVIIYGVTALFHISFFLTVIMILGLLFDALIPILTICLTAAFLRQFSGGAHAINSTFCTCIGCVVCLILSLAGTWLSQQDVSVLWYALVSAAVLVASFFTVYLLAPVDTPNKPIKTQEKRSRMRRTSFSILTVYTLLITLSLFVGKSSAWYLFALCMDFGIAWQTFMLTKGGFGLLKVIQKTVLFCIGKSSGKQKTAVQK